MKEIFVLMKRVGVGSGCVVCGVFTTDKAYNSALTELYEIETIGKDVSFDDFAALFEVKVFPADYLSYGCYV